MRGVSGVRYCNWLVLGWIWFLCHQKPYPPSLRTISTYTAASTLLHLYVTSEGLYLNQLLFSDSFPQMSSKAVISSRDLPQACGGIFSNGLVCLVKFCSFWVFSWGFSLLGLILFDVLAMVLPSLLSNIVFGEFTHYFAGLEDIFSAEKYCIIFSSIFWNQALFCYQEACILVIAIFRIHLRVFLLKRATHHKNYRGKKN